MENATRASKLAELEELRERVAELEKELAVGGDDDSTPDWRKSSYFSYYATTGFFLGILGALTSLLVNVFGAIAKGLPPLKLIMVYLTFGMGERALTVDSSSNAALALSIGCCLYIGTGMLYGILFQLVLSQLGGDTLGRRMVVASVLALGIWFVNYYVLLSWLQPLLFGGNWIIEQIPLAVATLTHLVYGWTQALVYPLGVWQPYRVETASE